MIRKRSPGLLPVIFLLLAACQEFPKDPGNTLKDVRNDILRVGIAESGKWASFQNDSASGIEVELIKQYALSINAKPEWIPAPQEQHSCQLRSITGNTPTFMVFIKYLP